MKNKIIFCNSGNQNSGKTSTIKLLCSLYENDTWKIKEKITIPDSNDIFCVFSKNNITLSIISYGDTEKERKKYMKKAINQYKSDIVVCSSRFNKECINWEDTLYGNYDVFSFSNFSTDRPEQNVINLLNSFSAETVYKVIELLLNEEI